jgi:hypothetical protein
MKSYVNKKIYLQKIGEFSGFKFWYVNGYFIRTNIDPAFTNFCYNRYMPFIPKDEFWIDKENGVKESHFFINSFLTIQKELKKGKEYIEAVRIADKLEKRERKKATFLKKVKKIKVKIKLFEKIHKKRLFKKYTKNLKIWQVKGHLVRSLFDLDFNQGGHGLVYPFVPKNEIWIDDDVYKKEIPYVLIHELHERHLMALGWKYDTAGQAIFVRKQEGDKRSAHFAAEALENECRTNPRKIMPVLLKEIEKNEASIAKEIEKSLPKNPKLVQKNS